MAKSEILTPFIRSWEGGYVNHPNDKGGATNRGVTIGTFRAVFGQSKTVEDLKNMTDGQWSFIYKKLYWDRWKADKINDQSIANLLVDWVWGSGIYGIKYAQQVIGVVADGLVGTKTLTALNAQDPKVLFNKLWERRKKHFISCASKAGQSVFLKGWLNRLNGIQFGKLKCNGGKIINF